MSELDKQESELFPLLRELPFDDALNPEHRDALRKQALQKFDQAKATTIVAQSQAPTLNSWRELMRRPIPRFIAISIVCLSIATPWLFFPGQQSTVFAFNDIA